MTDDTMTDDTMTDDTMTDAPVVDPKVRAEERAQRAERMAREGAQAMADHKAAIQAIDDRTVKLRALRLAKEAREAEEAASRPAPAPKSKTKRKPAAKV